MSNTLFTPKGKLEIGDKAHVAAQTPEEWRERFQGVVDGTVELVEGDFVSIRSENGTLTTLHRKYICNFRYLGHVRNPCIFCGYEDSESPLDSPLP